MGRFGPVEEGWTSTRIAHGHCCVWVRGTRQASSARDSLRPFVILLVDDVVDSRWTFTVAAWEPRRRGCKNVWPFALADAGMG